MKVILVGDTNPRNFYLRTILQELEQLKDKNLEIVIAEPDFKFDINDCIKISPFKKLQEAQDEKIHDFIQSTSLVARVKSAEHSQQHAWLRQRRRKNK